MNDLIEINKFSHLHDGERVIFCKTDYIDQLFESLEQSNNRVVLIIGNSARGIDDRVAARVPECVHRVYGQNVLTNDPRFVPIPEGLENSTVSALGETHGRAWPRSKTVQQHIMSCVDHTPDRLMYSNFRCRTDVRRRAHELSQQVDWISSDEPNLSVEQFHHNIQQHKITICPAGVGVDTHRLWQVLYLGRVPLTFRVGDYNIYNLYDKLPVIVLDSVEQLLDKQLIESQYQQVRERSMDAAYFGYWRDQIMNDLP